MNNLQNMKSRLNNRGGQEQQDRMIKDKQRTLGRAVKYSYQGAQVQLVNSEEIVPALMNPNRLLADYDEKIISVDYGLGFKTGEIFRWINPSKNNGDTYWLIYLQDLTELAYFRANVRRCSYQITWLDSDGSKMSTYATIVGPKDSKIETVSKSSFSLDIPNYTIKILIPKNENTLKQFDRYTQFYLQNLDDYNTPICWRVESVDPISIPGVLEIYAKEYYANEQTDDINNGIVDGLVDSIINNDNEIIVGDSFIKPLFEYSYEYTGTEDAEWIIDKKAPLEININDRKITIKWIKLYSGNFSIKYGSAEKIIKVETLL